MSVCMGLAKAKVRSISHNSDNKFREISNRHDAIVEALRWARQGDIVIIAGKGHETGQIIRNKKYPFSDKDIVIKSLKHYV